MKLSDLVFNARSRVTNSFVWVRYFTQGTLNPFTSGGRQFYFYRLWRYGLRAADKIDVKNPGKLLDRKDMTSRLRSGPGSQLERIRGIFGEAPPSEESSSQTATLPTPQVSRPLVEPEEPVIEQPRDTEFPLLTSRREIVGRRGRYQVMKFLGERGNGRLYKGIQLAENRSVIIKEYLLPQHQFNAVEREQRKQEFARLAGVNLADGKTRDFRLIGAIEAIADDRENRCYLITTGEFNSQRTLKNYLTEHGPFPEHQVHEVLRQVLQTLEFLHLHRFRLDDRQSVQRGLMHRNLGLDSLLWFENDRHELVNDRQFFIYVTDLGIWESLFEPPGPQRMRQSVLTYNPQTDLSDLGRLAFYLLIGQDRDDITQQPLDPRNSQLWRSSIDPHLKDFILQLLGVNGSFESAEAARQALPEITVPIARIDPPTTPESASKSNFKKYLLWGLGGAVALGCVGALAWWGVSTWQKASKDRAIKATQDSVPCCLNKVQLPTEKLTYASLKNDIWNYIFFRNSGLVAIGKTLEKELTSRLPGLKLSYQSVPSWNQAIEQLRNEKLDFLVTALPESSNEIGKLQAEFQMETIAYDGVAVFVPFVDIHRKKNLSKQLNGQITFDQLRKLYTGQVKNWKDIGGPDLPVKLYMPTDVRLIEMFEQRVFAEHPEELEQFRKLQKQGILKEGSTAMLGKVLKDFEVNEVGSIGFDSFSRVFGQCSVYPLAIAQSSKAVQALVQDNGQSVNPRSDLCDDKGGYGLDSQAFSAQAGYPLRYEIVVLDRRSNQTASAGKKFVEIWKTKEGQSLLKAAGLVPIVPSP